MCIRDRYRGGCNFETVGLSRSLVKDYFPGILSKISGIGLNGIEKKIRNQNISNFYVLRWMFLLEI